MHTHKLWLASLLLLGACGGGAASSGGGTAAKPSGPAGSVKLEDPSGDDDGPGTYKYPTDAVYTPGSFDMTEFEVERALRDALGGTIYSGTSEIQRRLIARQLGL